ncbi:hypothetical protein [Streptomyces sp. NPDC058157]|uniref:hypothetical protein n=1 Tax=Streptomyces sp. NPDC058157 TaxID=3346360 RepID=UPI0036EA2D1F
MEVPEPLATGTDLPEEAQPWHRQRLRIGLVQCADCATTVRCTNLETLPDHHCTERRRTLNASAG